MTDYYGTLGVAQGASDQELKRAYRQLAREFHPDVNPEEAAQVKFREITTAYEVLSDPEKRRIVDAGGDPMASAGAGGFGGFGGFAGGGLGDIFESFFSGGSSSRGPRGRVRPGNDALLRLELDLDDCATGVNKEVTVDTAILCDQCQGGGTNGDSKPVRCDTCKGAGEVQTLQRSILGQVMTTRECPTCSGAGETIPDPCGKCAGDGRVRARRTMTVKIPSGIANGMRVRLQGQGEVGAGGGPAGDLYVEISEEQHDMFVRDGADLHCTVKVPMVDAALGAMIVVDTVLGGKATVNIEPGTQPGHVVKARGQGMPRLHSGQRGDLLAHLEVVIPTKIDAKQKEHLKAYKAISHDQVTVVDAANDHGSGLFSRLRNAFASR